MFVFAYLFTVLWVFLLVGWLFFVFVFSNFSRSWCLNTPESLGLKACQHHTAPVSPQNSKEVTLQKHYYLKGTWPPGHKATCLLGTGAGILLGSLYTGNKAGCKVGHAHRKYASDSFLRAVSQSSDSYSVLKQSFMLLDVRLLNMSSGLCMICKGSWKKASESRRKVYLHDRGVSLNHVSLKM